MTSSEEGHLTVDRLAALFAALAEKVRVSDALLLFDQSPPRETDSPSMTVGAEEGEEKPRLSVTFDPASGQVVFEGVYWRSGEFTPGMRERHGLLFNPVTFRLEADGYELSDPRRPVQAGESGEVERYDSAREAAEFLVGLLEHFHGKVADRSD